MSLISEKLAKIKFSYSEKITIKNCTYLIFFDNLQNLYTPLSYYEELIKRENLKYRATIF